MKAPAPPYIFIPLQNFDSPEMRSAYVQGLTYTVKDDADHVALHKQVGKWLNESPPLVRIPAPGENVASSGVVGRGVVTNKDGTVSTRVALKGGRTGKKK